MNWQNFEQSCWVALIFCAFITAISYIFQVVIKLRNNKDVDKTVYLDDVKYSQLSIHNARWLSFFFVLLGFISIMQGFNIELLRGDIIIGKTVAHLIPANLSVAKTLFVVGAVFMAFIGLNCLYLSGTIIYLNRASQGKIKFLSSFEAWLELVLGVFLILISIIWGYYGFEMSLQFDDASLLPPIDLNKFKLAVPDPNFVSNVTLVAFIVSIIAILTAFGFVIVSLMLLMKALKTTDKVNRWTHIAKVAHALVLTATIIVFMLILLAEWEFPMTSHNIFA
ncbi:MAG: hypothetical protein ACRAS9_00610 [Mycoplasma sp.]